MRQTQVLTVPKVDCMIHCTACHGIAETKASRIYLRNRFVSDFFIFRLLHFNSPPLGDRRVVLLSCAFYGRGNLLCREDVRVYMRGKQLSAPQEACGAGHQQTSPPTMGYGRKVPVNLRHHSHEHYPRANTSKRSRKSECVTGSHIIL
jgi:hypothetical protein